MGKKSKRSKNDFKRYALRPTNDSRFLWRCFYNRARISRPIVKADRAIAIKRWKINCAAAAQVISRMEKMLVGETPVQVSWITDTSKRTLTGMDVLATAFSEGAGIELPKVETTVSKVKATKEEKAELAKDKLASTSANRLLWAGGMNTKVVTMSQAGAESKLAGIFASGAPAVNIAALNALNRGGDLVQFSDAQLIKAVTVARMTPDGQHLKETSVFAERKNGWENITTIDSKTASMSRDKKMNTDEMKSFLLELGFQDYAKMIRQQVGRPENNGIAEINKNQQEYSIRTFEARNMALELAVEMMNRMQSRMGSELGQKQVAQLAAFLTSQQAIKPLNNFPRDVIAENEEKREEKLVAATEKATLVNMQEHSERLISTMLTYLYGSKVAEDFKSGVLEDSRRTEITDMIRFMTPRVTKIVEVMYLDVNNGSCRDLGSAFTLLAARQSELRDMESKWRSLAKGAFQRYGLYYETIVDGSIVSVGSDGKIVSLPLETSDIVLTKTKESLNSSVIAPGVKVHPDLASFAQKNGLQGSLLAAVSTTVGSDAVTDGFSFIERMRDQAFDKTDGFSHYGEARVFTAKDSKIRRGTVRHNYPHAVADAEKNIPGEKHLPGGWTEVDTFGYFNSSHHARIGVAHKDREKMFQMFMDQAAKSGVRHLELEQKPILVLIFLKWKKIKRPENQFISKIQCQNLLGKSA